MPNYSKKTTSSFPIKDIKHLKLKELGEYLIKCSAEKRHDLKEDALAKVLPNWDFSSNSWILDQAIAHLQNAFPPVKSKNSSDLGSEKYSILETFKDLDKDPFTYAIVQIFKSDIKRSILVKYQNRDPRYSALVPLVLASYKKFRNIKYSDWERSELKWVLPTNLKELIAVSEEEYLEALGDTNLEELRNDFCAGKTPEQMSPNIGRYCDTPFKGFPKYLGLTEMQLWVAAPSLRHEYMILNYKDLDKMPEPLVKSSVLTEDHDTALSALMIEAPTKKSSHKPEPVADTPFLE